MAIFVVFCLCLGFAGCDAESKMMAKVEEKIYSYEFSSADAEEIFMDSEANAFVVYTKSEKIFTSFGVTVD